MSAGITTATSPDPRRTALRAGLVMLLAAVAVAGVAWAKWLPYSAKIQTLASTRAWSGSAIFGEAGRSAPSLHGAATFWHAYLISVWRAALVAVVIAVILEVAVSDTRLFGRLRGRSPLGQSALSAVAALPTMMCTCCTAPLAVALRRRGAPMGAVASYWLGNPVLNPAVLVFLALTLPWQFVAARFVWGVLLVVGSGVLVARLASPGSPEGAVPGDIAGPVPGPLWRRSRDAAIRYLAILIPEYLVIVLVTAWLTPWLADFTGIDRTAARVGLVLVALVGTALVVPTGGEVPVIAGLLAAGVGRDVAGVLLITLPALSLPSLVLVRRAFSLRVKGALVIAVVVAGLGAGLTLAALS